MLTRIKSTKSISSRIRQFSTVSNRTSRATQFRFSTSFSTTAVDSVLHRRNDFRYTLPIQTRWKDNDQYGHVNNVVYYSYFDTAVNHFLYKEAGLIGANSKQLGYVVHSNCDYIKPIAYPEIITAGVAVTKVGNSSVHWKIGIFGENCDTAAAIGSLIHVFVDSKTKRPSPLSSEIRNAIDAKL